MRAVTLEVASKQEVTRRALEALKGKKLGVRISPRRQRARREAFARQQMEMACLEPPTLTLKDWSG